jgi:hypothetical protein
MAARHQLIRSIWPCDSAGLRLGVGLYHSTVPNPYQDDRGVVRGRSDLPAQRRRDAVGASRAPAALLERPADQEPAASAVGPDWRHWLHGGLTLAAVMGLVVGTRGLWTSYALTRPGFAVTITACYLIMLVAAVLTLCARSTAGLVRLDVIVLGTAILLKALAFWPFVIGERKITVDEGILMDRATRVLAAGHDPYLRIWSDIDPSLPTRLMDGGTVHGFGYPPFGIELGAVLQRVFLSSVGIVTVSCLALLATAIVVFCVAPTPLRPLATLGVLVLSTLTAYAQNAYPALIALPFLCIAAWRWPSIGRGGRLGGGGLLRAIALGLALSTHQLGLFLAVFLVVGLAVLRGGELSGRATVGLLVRYVGLVAAVFLLVSLPFVAHASGAWLRGVTGPLLQHAVPHGQGIMGVSQYLIGGSGALDFYGYAAIGLLLATLVTFAVHLRWLGPAAVVLPWLVFMVSTRSQDGYLVLTMPLWIVGLCTTTLADFAGAYRFRMPDFLPRLGAIESRARVVGVLATVALFIPAAVCLAVAIATPQPLVMRVATALKPGHSIQSLAVQVTNRSSRLVTPHFAVTTDVTIADFWSVASGPSTIAPHSTAQYTLIPPHIAWRPTDTAFLRAVSDHPQTLSSQRL